MNHSLFQIQDNVLEKLKDGNRQRKAHLVVPQGVTSIRSGAFGNCKDIKSITLPSTLKTIGVRAFANCRSLTSIQFPEGLEEIEESAFLYCGVLESITFPSSLKTLKNNAFGHCDSLQTVVIPNSITSMGTEVFTHCRSLTSVSIQRTEVPEGTFSHCQALWVVDLKEGVTTIGSSAFSHCTSLTGIYIPNSVQSLSHQSFAHDTALKEIHFPTKLETLPTECFSHCTSLHSLTLPKPLQKMGDHCFSHCTSLESLTLPKPLQEMGDHCFSHCSSLQSISFPEHLQKMGDHCFSHCTSLESLTLPEHLQKMGDHCFSTCASLESLTFPEKLDTIPIECFSNCTSLTSILLPDSVTHIYEGAFSGCKALKTLGLPQHLQYLGSNAIHACPSLHEIYKKHSEVPCEVAPYTLLYLKTFHFLDPAVMVFYPTGTLYHYCEEYWEKKKGTPLHDSIKEVLCTHPPLLDYALRQKNIPIITTILEEVDTIPLLQLEDYIQISIKRKTTELTARFLNYQREHYTQREVDAYQERKDMIDIGFALPTLEEFSRQWMFERDAHGIEITGYHGVQKVAMIPKTLDDGTPIINFTSDHYGFSTTTLEHLEIDADLHRCGIYQELNSLKSIKITGKILSQLHCTGLSHLTSFTYEGKGHSHQYFYFVKCALDTVILPHGIRELNPYSFRHCSNLQSVTIPPSVMYIHEKAFDNCGTFTIYGKAGSTAETFCQEQGIPFVESPE